MLHAVSPQHPGHPFEAAAQQFQAQRQRHFDRAATAIASTAMRAACARGGSVDDVALLAASVHRSSSIRRPQLARREGGITVFICQPSDVDRKNPYGIYGFPTG